MIFEIKTRRDGSVLFSAEAKSLSACVEAAVKAGADLTGADLTGANLAWANLAWANLTGANLAWANLAGAKILHPDHTTILTLVGQRPVFQIGPLGSRCAYLVAFVTDAGVFVRTGCFWGTLDAFRAAVVNTHGENEHAQEYAAAAALIEAHARLWTPAKALSHSDACNEALAGAKP